MKLYIAIWSFPSLRYPSVDCQGLGEALAKATQGFPNKEVIIHHDFAAQLPILEGIRQSLERIVSSASRSKGFCALLSCDRGQKSWEFPELGHGVFTYFLMQGLLGEAADQYGVIEADGLYKYVYRQTLLYIDKMNEQLRLVNQQKRDRGDHKVYPEYPRQTPKRIVEGVGELVIGFKPANVVSNQVRRGLIIDGFANNQNTVELVDIFRNYGGFQLGYFHGINHNLAEIKVKIKELVSWSDCEFYHSTGIKILFPKFAIIYAIAIYQKTGRKNF
jgi:uncharacterized caspase-like protein